jgi:hypothetical protein
MAATIALGVGGLAIAYLIAATIDILRARRGPQISPPARVIPNDPATAADIQWAYVEASWHDFIDGWPTLEEWSP